MLHGVAFALAIKMWKTSGWPRAEQFWIPRIYVEPGHIVGLNKCFIDEFLK